MIGWDAWKKEAWILNEAKPAIEGWITQDDATGGAIGLELGKGRSNKRAANTLALMGGSYRDGPQAEPADGLACHLHWGCGDVTDDGPLSLGHQRNSERVGAPKGLNNEMLGLTAERVTRKGLPRDGINFAGIGGMLISDGERSHALVA